MIAPATMNNQRLRELIRKKASTIHADELGFWKFEFQEMLVFVMTDESHNRMRIISPVLELDSIPDELWKVLMSANFDRALDARYCVNDDMLWSAFIHPLEQLHTSQFLDGLQQVVTLAKNYGTSYSSGDVVFNG